MKLKVGIFSDNMCNSESDQSIMVFVALICQKINPGFTEREREIYIYIYIYYFFSRGKGIWISEEIGKYEEAPCISGRAHHADKNRFSWTFPPLKAEKIIPLVAFAPFGFKCIYYIWVVATQIIVYFHPYLGKIPILTNTNIFQMGWFNHQLVVVDWKKKWYRSPSNPGEIGDSFY